LFDEVAAVWEYDGAPRSLVHAFKLHKMHFLAESLAPFVLLQIEALNWPWPDMITAIPQNILRGWTRGYNPAELLGREVAKLCRSQYVTLLKKEVGSLPQSAKTRAERLKTNHSQYHLIEKEGSRHKRILIIDDVLTSGQTFHDAAVALLPLVPQQLYAIALARGDS
jgi:predicted amidophosphoribosyltransferase